MCVCVCVLIWLWEIKHIYTNTIITYYFAFITAKVCRLFGIYLPGIVYCVFISVRYSLLLVADAVAAYFNSVNVRWLIGKYGSIVAHMNWMITDLLSTISPTYNRKKATHTQKHTHSYESERCGRVLCKSLYKATKKCVNKIVLKAINCSNAMRQLQCEPYERYEQRDFHNKFSLVAQCWLQPNQKLY